MYTEKLSGEREKDHFNIYCNLYVSIMSFYNAA